MPMRPAAAAFSKRASSETYCVIVDDQRIGMANGVFSSQRGIGLIQLRTLADDWRAVDEGH